MELEFQLQSPARMTITNVKLQNVFTKKASVEDAQPGAEWAALPTGRAGMLLSQPGLPKLFPGLRCPFPSSSSNFYLFFKMQLRGPLVSKPAA